MVNEFAFRFENSENFKEGELKLLFFLFYYIVYVY
jgi:hypothetical protein